MVLLQVLFCTLGLFLSFVFYIALFFYEKEICGITHPDIYHRLGVLEISHNKDTEEYILCQFRHNFVERTERG